MRRVLFGVLGAAAFAGSVTLSLFAGDHRPPAGLNWPALAYGLGVVSAAVVGFESFFYAITGRWRFQEAERAD